VISVKRMPLPLPSASCYTPAARRRSRKFAGEAVAGRTLAMLPSPR
jgi:hypothetical protein